MAIDQVLDEGFSRARAADTTIIPVPPPVFTPGDDMNVSDEHLAAEYTQFVIDTRYKKDTGLRVLATGSPSGATTVNEVVRVHKGTMTKVVKWTAERLKEEPDLPSSDTNNPNEVLIDSEIIGANPLQLPGGQVWRVSGTYTYALLKPYDETSMLPLGTTPLENEASNEHAIGPTAYDDSLLDASFAPPP